MESEVDNKIELGEERWDSDFNFQLYIDPLLPDVINPLINILKYRKFLFNGTLVKYVD